MNIPQSTPAVPATFQGVSNSESPQEFHQFLLALVAQHLTVEPPVSILPDTKDGWAAVLAGLSDHFLATFSAYGDNSWTDMADKIKVLDVTVDFIPRVAARLHDVYVGPGDLAKKLFARLINFWVLLDVWVDVPDLDLDGLPTPQSLQERAFLAILSIIHHLGNGTVVSVGDESPMWVILRSILLECIEVSQDILSLTIPSFPIRITLFGEKPRVHDATKENFVPPSPSDLPCNITLDLASQTPVLLGLILNVLANIPHPIPVVPWFYSEIDHKSSEITRAMFDYFVSCPTTTIKRVRCLTVAVSFVKILLSTRRVGEEALVYPLCRLLRFRLQEGPNAAWSDLDRALSKTFESSRLCISIDADIDNIIKILRTESWGEEGQDLRELAFSYLRASTNFSDHQRLQTLKESLLGSDREQLAALAKEIDKQIAPPAPAESVDEVVVDLPSWHLRVKASVEDIIAGEDIDWMDADEGMPNHDYAQRALDTVNERYTRPLLSTTASTRVSLADKLLELLCLLAHSGTSECHSSTNLHISTIPLCLVVIPRLLDGEQVDVTHVVRKKAYDMVARMIRHHSHTCEGMDSVRDIIFRGIVDQDRSVRLSAGRALKELSKFYAAKNLVLERVVPLFNQLHTLLETAKDPVIEALLVTVGSIGKESNVDVLRQVLCFLISQLGRENPVHKGISYMQILAISKHHKKAPYSLVFPYLDQIAPFLVYKMATQPSLLTDSCRLLSIFPADFISTTLPRTLPGLFANCDVKVLEMISKDLQKKPSTLFLNFSHEILAHVFLLPTSVQTNKALHFILKVLTDAVDNAPIDIESVVKSCVVSLLGDLVIVMGHQNETESEKAINALKKVERLLNVPARGSRVIPPQDLGLFLKTYMLGIVTVINDLLRDVQGKKSILSKRQILRSLGTFVVLMGPSIANVAPQIMATFQTMVGIPELAEVTLESWHNFLSTLGPDEVGPHVGPTSATLVSLWPQLSPRGQEVARESLGYIIHEAGPSLGKHLDEVVDFVDIPELHELHDELTTLRGSWTPKQKLQRILERSSSDNLTMAAQSLGELKVFMLTEQNDFIRDLASGDMFDPLVGQILAALLAAACRDGDGTDTLKLLAFECIGVLGAVDPDRCEIGFNDPRMIVLRNFTDEEESLMFATHLIKDLLVGAFRSTSDIIYQSHLAYSIQELLRICNFTPSLVAAGNNNAVPLKVRARWNSLPKQVLETVTPLLEARFSIQFRTQSDLKHPIYPGQRTYREWIQNWTAHLITKASGPARTIFSVFRAVVRNKDVGVAHHLLPHLVLNILISGNNEDTQNIRSELLVVLQDQIDGQSTSTAEKKLFSAQVVFILLDHLNKWVRIVRQELSMKKPDNKRARSSHINQEAATELSRVDSILSSIDQNLMARAALQCKAYARSLMNFERQIVFLRQSQASSGDLPGYYERLHEIYARLDEPDGMEGISTLILSPSLEHQIRQHESTGRWTSAQSCWEVRLQQSPDKIDFHIGLLRCLRNLGHYDTLRTHVRGVLTRNPDWEAALAGFQVESAWMVGAWDDVRDLVDRTASQSPPIVMARLLLAMRTGEKSAITESLSAARYTLGSPITAAGEKGYRRSYDAVLNLHLTHELELICHATSSGTNSRHRRQALAQLSQVLSSRLDATLPTFRTREPILSMRRTAFSLCATPRPTLNGEIGRSWLASAKIARKAGQWQTAYSAMLQARQSNTKFSFMESAKLLKATGEPLRALQELENSMRVLGLLEDKGVIDLTGEEEEKKMKAKAQVLRARWMNESDRFDTSMILKTFQIATELHKHWESGHYHLGQFHDQCFKNLSRTEQLNRGLKMNLYTVRFFAKSIRYGSKYVYQTVPRLLTIWLDMGEIDKPSSTTTEVLNKLNAVIDKAIKDTPVYKWYTAFPQIVSRVGHTNDDVYERLSKLIVMVLQQYPKQALWLFTSVIKSTKPNREKRGRQILEQLRSNPSNARSQVPNLINQCISMTNELLALCDYNITDDSKKSLSMKKDFPGLQKLGRSPLIIPLQESLIASLPPSSSSESIHQPFPPNAPTFAAFADEVDIMRSLAKPRKITIKGSDGQIYMFLGKPKDDLRKDARLMDFNAIINKLLKANSESRRRQLHIRTYGVITLNEECGFIQWVPNTIPIRPVLIKGYDSKKIRSWSSEMNDVFKKIKDAGDKVAGELFVEEILPLFPPVFHEWFIETFPEPSAWLASRLAYGRTAAVMSMVGFILGLGDRHCENILLDSNTGDVVHVDFNCLFEKGKTLETPEKVPFRLTQNLVDGLGVTGVEGVFRIACEVTMQLLRDNKDSLMSVLDAFIHDPLVEWEDEKRKLERHTTTTTSRSRNNVKPSVDLRMLAKNALNPIEKKLKGIYSTSKERQEKEISTSNLVQMLIQEATDNINLARMYPGWASWH